jgi:hypothetical protein
MGQNKPNVSQNCSISANFGYFQHLDFAFLTGHLDFSANFVPLLPEKVSLEGVLSAILPLWTLLPCQPCQPKPDFQYS